MQRAAVELLLLSLPAGILGSWIVLRRLAFFAHAVGPATFPALTVAQAASFNPQAAALIFAGLFPGTFDWMTRKTRTSRDAATGLILVGSLALGALLASDVFASSGQVDTLLFGSVLSTGTTELGLTVVVAVLTVLSFAVLERSWLAPVSTRRPQVVSRQEQNWPTAYCFLYRQQLLQPLYSRSEHCLYLPCSSFLPRPFEW